MRITKFSTLIWNSQPHIATGYDRLAASNRLQHAIKYCIKVRKMGGAGTEAHNSVTAGGKITSNDTLNSTTVDVYRDCKLKWRSILPRWAFCCNICHFAWRKKSIDATKQRVYANLVLL